MTRLSHGLSKTKQYNAWNHMMFRCYSKKDKRYKHYGGRGISVDPKWHNFVGFWEDMKYGFKDDLTLDRIDVNGNYCKENCRWVSWIKQQRNRRDAYIVNYQNKNISLKDLCEEKNISYMMTYLRLTRYGWNLERALLTPSKFKQL